MRKIWLLCLVLLTACAGPLRSTPVPTPVILDVALTPSLRPFTETLHTCAVAHPEFVINVHETPASALENQTTDLVIRWGETSGNGYAAPIGEESLVLIVNASNPVLTIPVEKIRDIFLGRITSWVDVGGEQLPVQVWVYPEGDDAREIFDTAIFPGDSLTPDAWIAPNPQGMLEAVRDDPFAIGYVPQTWLAQARSAEQVRPLKIDQKLVEKLHQSILALSRDEPEGSLRQLLVCMQSAVR
jgi:DNA-binding transcriptional LysR family regulator